MEEANGRGYKLDHVAFVSSGGEPVELGGISDSEKKQIVIIGTKPSEELVVNTYGRILYINQSADSDFYDLICTKSFMTFLTVHQRIGKAAQMSAGYPCLIRQFNLMFKTFQGVTEDAKNTVYLRPETAQGIFVNLSVVALE